MTVVSNGLSKLSYLITFVFVFLIFSTKFINGANILGLMPVGSPSHHLWNSVILHGLAERGHNVTILSADLPKNPKEVPKNVHYIHLEEVYNGLYSQEDESVDITSYIDLPVYKEIPQFYDNFGILNNKGALKSKGFQTLLNYPDSFKFDVIVFDFTIGGSLLGFLHKFNYPPLVGVSAFLLSPINLDFVGGHIHPAYIPYYSLTYDTNMNFLQRLYNTFLYVYDAVYRQRFFTPVCDSMMREYFKRDDIPYLGDLQSRMTVSLVNSFPSINYPQPIPPNIIEVGGVQVQDPKPLDKELEQFVNKSKKGAVFFSLGTNMKPENIGPKNADIILRVMEHFSDYHFLWKFDVKFIKRKIPDNVLTRTFFPQKDVLAHPKLKLFVTHSGGLSTQEATWRGVPMVGIPLFVDQHRNLYKSLLVGVAVKVDYLTLTEENLKNAISEVLNNKTYAENMKIVSAQFRDRPMKPLDTAIWWIEYVLRHPNPQYLISPVHRLGFFVANSFDILAFLLIVILGSVWILIKVLKKLLHFQSITKKKVVKND